MKWYSFAIILLLLKCRGNKYDDDNTVIYYNSYDPNDPKRK